MNVSIDFADGLSVVQVIMNTSIRHHFSLECSDPGHPTFATQSEVRSAYKGVARERPECADPGCTQVRW